MGAGDAVAAGRKPSPRYTEALTACKVRLVRLTAPTETIRQRLRVRETGDRLDRDLTTLASQIAILDAAGIEDFTVPNDRPPPPKSPARSSNEPTGPPTPS